MCSSISVLQHSWQVQLSRWKISRRFRCHLGSLSFSLYSLDGIPLVPRPLSPHNRHSPAFERRHETCLLYGLIGIIDVERAAYLIAPLDQIQGDNILDFCVESRGSVDLAFPSVQHVSS